MNAVEEIYSFGMWVRQRRKWLDLTQAALAERVSCAEVTIRKVEADVVRPSREVAERLAQCLEVQRDERDVFVLVARGLRSVDSLSSPFPAIHAPNQAPEQMTLDTLIHQWLKRAHVQPHTVALEAGLSEAQFLQVTKTIDPAHKRDSDPDHVVAVLRVFAMRTNPQHRCTTQEAIRFLQLTRFPIDRSSEVAGWFPTNEWQHALAKAGYSIVQPTASIPPSPTPVQPHTADAMQNAHPGQRVRRHNLPHPVTSFIGRPAEVAAISRHVGGHGGEDPATTFRTRLLTLVGVGGVGKTRLAVHAGRALQDVFADGIWFVDLAPLVEPTMVVRAIATVLNVSETNDESPLIQIEQVIRDKHLLLILDNCEHLIDTCAAIVEHLLGACANIVILATSREALWIAGETHLLVPPLSLPESPRQPITELLANVHQHDVMQSEAVQMFLDRARNTNMAFTLTEQNAPAVARICQLVDGLPLAIELAAARLNLFSVEQLAAQLHDRLGLLTTGSRTAAKRQQTLRASIDWSYQLLDEAERMALRRLAVFAGGWTLEAAQAIAACSVQMLGQLVQKSLVTAVTDQGGGARYYLLATIQQYALEKLGEADEAACIRLDHMEYFLRSAEAEEPYVAQAEHHTIVKKLERELDNFRAALDWAAAQPDALGELRLVAALYPFWNIRGYWNEGRDRLRHASSRVPTIHLPILQARVLYAAALFAYHQGDTEEAARSYAESLSLYEQADHRLGVADVLIGLGQIAWRLGQYDAAINHYAQSLQHYQALDHQPGIAQSLQGLGTIYRDLRDYKQAQPLLEQSLAMYRAQNRRSECATTLRRLGEVVYRLGDAGLSRRYVTESLRLQYELGDPVGVAYSLMALGNFNFVECEYQAAEPLYLQAVEVFREIGDKVHLGMTLSNLGEVCYLQGNYDSALTYYTAGLELVQQSSDSILVLNTLMNIGFNCLHLAHYQQAARYFVKSLRLAHELESEYAIHKSAANLIGLASICQEQDDLQAACYLFGALERWLPERRHMLKTVELMEYDHYLPTIRRQLTDETLAAAWAAGQRTSLPQLLAVVNDLPVLTTSSERGLTLPSALLTGGASQHDSTAVGAADEPAAGSRGRVQPSRSYRNVRSEP